VLLHCCKTVLCLLADTGLLIKQVLAFGSNFFALDGQLLFKKISFVLCLAYQSKQFGNMLIFCLLHMKLDRLCDIAQERGSVFGSKNNSVAASGTIFLGSSETVS